MDYTKLISAVAVVGLLAGCASEGDQSREDDKATEKANAGEKSSEGGESSTADAKPPAVRIAEAKETRTNQAPTKEDKWGYSGDVGPENWGRLAPEFAMCELGKNQSPVDLAGAIDAKGVPKVQVDYGEKPEALVHKGHAVQANFPGGKLTVGERSWKLIQLHFHTPSEHTVDGSELPLEAHFVHSDGDGNLAVLGVMFEEGDSNPQLGALLQETPEKKGDEVSLAAVNFQPEALLPDDLSAFRYNGSLTTPPCSEGVRFHILTESVEASADQVDALREVVGHDNARPIQPLNARTILR